MNIVMKRWSLRGIAPDAAAQGQRPGNMPAQGNALGWQNKKDKALKGRDSMVPPFQGFGSLFADYPGRCPGLACLRAVGAPKEGVR